jgi:pimeloyl-ACP methyl ester carboxylesterase
MTPESLPWAQLEDHWIDSDGVRLHAVALGEGPLVVFCHGFPGLWYSWRHQLPMVARLGFRAVAIDQRGYGQSGRPREVADYDSTRHCDDLLAVLRHFGEERAIFVGHDFGTAQVWNMAVRHPEACVAIVPTSCPYDFDLAGRGCAGSQPSPGAGARRPFARPDLAPSACFAALAEHHFFHMHYFQSVGPAEAELGPSAREFLTRLYWALSGKGNLLGWNRYPSDGAGYLDVLAPAPPLPWPWMNSADFDYLAQQYLLAGEALAFIGGLNSYRVADRNWQIGLPWADAQVEVPTLFVAGAEDVVLQMIGDDALALMAARAPDLREVQLLEGAGHFMQMERPLAFNRVLGAFLESFR